MDFAELTQILRAQHALIVHFSHSAKGSDRLLYPDDLRNAITVAASKDLSCSLVWPERCNAVGSLGVVIRPLSLASIKEISCVDGGTIPNPETGRRRGLGQPLTRQILASVFNSTSDEYNELVVGDAEAAGIFVDLSRPLQIAAMTDLRDVPGYDERLVDIGPIVGPRAIDVANVASDFPGLAVYAFRDGEIINLTNGQVVAPTVIYP